MLFAYQKLRQRRGKDTLFHIRGQVRHRQDVEHYWKRKRFNPASLSHIANTPDGVQYHTPSPFPEEDSPGAEAKKTAPDDLSPAITTDEQANLFQHIDQELRLTPRSSSLRLLSPPEPLKMQNQALHYVGVYYQAHIELASVNPYYHSTAGGRGLVNEFFQRALNTLWAMRRGLSQVNIAAAQLNMFRLIPEVLRNENPRLLVTLLQVIAEYHNAAQQTRLNAIVMLGHEIVNRIASACRVAHPLSSSFEP